MSEPSDPIYYTRSNFNYGTPAMAVNFTKKKHLKKTAQIFLYKNFLHKVDVRFDIVEVIIKNGKCEINHIEGIM